MLATPSFALPLRMLLATASGDYHALIANIEQTQRITVTHLADRVVCYLIYTCASEEWALSDRLCLIDYALLNADPDFIKSMARFGIRLVNADIISEAEKLLALAVIDRHARSNLCRAAVNRVIARRKRSELISANRALRCIGQEAQFAELRPAIPIKDLRAAILQCISEANASPRFTYAPHTSPTRFLFVISHIPANERTGAHLFQVRWSITSLLRAEGSHHVMLLVTNEHAASDGFPWRRYSPSNMARLETFLLAELQPGERSRFSFPLLPAPSITNYEEVVQDHIRTFSPHVAIRWGGNVESEIFDDYIYPTTAYVYSQLNAKNIPRREFDIYLAHGKRSDFQSLPSPDRWRTNVLPVAYRRSNNTREDYTGAPRFVSVLGNGRIEQVFISYTSEHLSFIERILDLCAHWTLVGVKDKDAILRTELLEAAWAAGRLRILEHHADLAHLYSQHDMFLSLPGFTGGGGGLAIAAVEGLIVFSNREADGANFTPDELIFDSIDSYLNCVTEVVHNKELKIKAAELIKLELHKHSMEGYARALLTSCREAYILAHQRWSESSDK